ncbi:MAG: hypothetical protein ACTHJ0_08965 [Flavipsychrobacter sp.]
MKKHLITFSRIVCLIGLHVVCLAGLMRAVMIPALAIFDLIMVLAVIAKKRKHGALYRSLFMK